MSTTSTVPAVLDAFLAAINQQMAGVTAFESWPGPEATAEMVFLGEVTWDDYEIATIKAGRKQRDETWHVEFDLWVAGQGDTTPANPKPQRDRAFQILTAMENVLAVDPTAGSGFATVQHVQIHPENGKPIRFEGGWAWAIKGHITTHARLL